MITLGFVLGKLFLLFTLVTLAETYLLYVFGAALGPWWTLGLILVSAALGAFLTKREGLKIWRAWKEALAAGKMPEEGLTSGALVLVGAVLLVTPGVLTDVTGMLCLIPPTRRFFAKYVKAYVEKRFASGATVTTRVRIDLGGGRYAERVETTFGGFHHSSRSGDPDVIDVEGEVIEEVRASDKKETPRLEEPE